MAQATSTPSSNLTLAAVEPAAPGRALLPGTVLAEFEFGSVLADSRFAIVYQATDHSMDRPVAIKEYLPTSLTTRSEGVKVQLRTLSHAHAFERGRRSFIEEAKQLGRCEHPSLLQVHRLLHAHGTVYRVMPYCPGISLLQLRQQMHAPPDEAELRALLSPLLGALDMLHRQGLVHGAVTPAKILLQRPDDRPLLLDFGAVRRSIVSDPTRSWMTLLGSSSDVLDHQADATTADAAHRWPTEGPPGPWNDVSAVAAVLYFWISGHWPEYPPAEPLSRMVARLHACLPQLDYSAALLGTIDAALAPALQDRPQSVAQFSELLARGDSAPARAWAGDVMAVPEAHPAVSPAVQAQTDVDITLPDALPDAQPAATTSDTPDATAPAASSPSAAPSAAPPPTPPAAPAAERDREMSERLQGSEEWAARRPKKGPRRTVMLAGAAALALLVLAAGGWQLQRLHFANVAQSVLANAARGNAPPTPPAELPAVDALPDSPLAACKSLRPATLPQCMQTLCVGGSWSAHPQCKQLRETGRID